MRAFLPARVPEPTSILRWPALLLCDAFLLVVLGVGCWAVAGDRALEGLGAEELAVGGTASVGSEALAVSIRDVGSGSQP